MIIQSTRKIFPFILILVFTYLLFTDCAQIGSPQGGPKDSIPPNYLGSTPENRALNFNKEKIVIRFDEFFVLKDLQQKFTVSPPLETVPKVRIKNKSLVITLEEELKDSTTYTFDFADVIQDNNENNPINDFEYVLSTWDKIDSLSIAGQVLNSFTLEPEIGVFVMLYKNYRDSTPYLRIPDYLCRTNDTGGFFVNNISKGSYRIFAINDATSNMLFDQPTEPIAFTEHVFEPKAEIVHFTDTIKVQRDSVMVDSIFTEKRTLLTPSDILLLMFTQDAEKQYMVTNERSQAGLCTFVFNKTVSEDFALKPLNFELDAQNEIFEISEKHDTINYWIVDTLVSQKDTLAFSISYQQLDSMNNVIVVNDTLEMKFKDDTKNDKKRRRKKKDEVVEIPKLKTSFNIRQGQLLDLKKDVSISADFPVRTINTDKIQLYRKDDTLLLPEKFDLKQDSIKIRKYYIAANWEADIAYQLTVDSLAFMDYNGLTNDSTTLNFKIQKESYYGSIDINLTTENIEGQVIIQLLRDENIVQQVFTNKSGEVEITTVTPGKYKLKAIFDYNKNNIWDTGDYLKKLQPEAVYYFKDEIKIKTNFEYKLDWTLP